MLVIEVLANLQHEAKGTPAFYAGVSTFTLLCC